MNLTFKTTDLPINIPNPLITLINNELAQSDIKTHIKQANTVTLNFRDLTYSPESGGFHPVEIQLINHKEQQQWYFNYLTDFAYCGIGYPELEKELDFDIGLNIGMQSQLGEKPLAEYAQLFDLWVSNFISYHQMQVYQVSISLG
jgi:hypothetical protein